MRGWGAADDFLEQIQATVDERVDEARAQLLGVGSEFCEDCDRLIPLARRKAIPNAVRCVSCQSHYE